MKKKVGLKDIAEQVGTSIVTVSNALSGKEGVSESLRDEIVRMADRLGYDLSKYGYTGSESFRLGVIVSSMYISVGTSFYWQMYQEVARAAADMRGFTLLEILDTEAQTRSELPKCMVSGEVDGIIVTGPMTHDYTKLLLDSASIPVVLLDFYHPDLGCDAVMSNNYFGMYKSTRYLLDRGHRRVAFVGNIEANKNIMDRYFGYLRAMRESGIEVPDKWIIPDRITGEWEISVRLPDENDSDFPTAFACNCDYAAGVVYDLLKERGLKVPEDISITAYDDYLYDHPFASELTTYRVDMRGMASEAVAIAAQRIRREPSFRGERFIDSALIERTSVKSLK